MRRQAIALGGNAGLAHRPLATANRRRSCIDRRLLSDHDRRITVTRIGGMVRLGELLGRIARNYDQSLGFSSPAQQLLKTASSEFSQWVPSGYMTVGSGGKGVPAAVPWIANFDPDETTTARRGMYVVYLFAEDGSQVYLSLAQGVTEIVEQWGRRVGREKLRAQALAIREAIGIDLRVGLDDAVDLRSRQPLARDYEAGTILARAYAIDALPPEDSLVGDLVQMMRLYQAALDAREQLRATTPSVIFTPASDSGPVLIESLEFKPKDDSAYEQQISQRTIRKSRKHETLIREYGTYIRGHGLVVATNVHPRDMTIYAADSHWLVEAKIVRCGNGVFATREALGQLLFYRRFLYPEPDRVKMLALFNESIGSACVSFLDELGISVVWKEDGQWMGSGSAAASGLC